jgi:hypothetical protein
MLRHMLSVFVRLLEPLRLLKRPFRSQIYE